MDAFNTQYYFIFSCLAFFSLLVGAKIDFKREASRLPVIYLIPVLIAIVYLFGTRGKDIGGDSQTYIDMFHNVKLQKFGVEFFNSFLFTVIGQFTSNYQVLFIVYSTLFVVVYILALKRFSRLFNTNFALVVFAAICIFTFKNMGINIMRQGVALSFFLLALALFLDKNKWSYFFFVVSVGFHSTSLVLIALVFLQGWIKKVNINILYGIYFVAIVLSYFSIGIKNLASIVDFTILDHDRTDGYLNTTYIVYETGFKINFVIFNTVFLVLFYFIKKYFKNENYEWLLRLFIVTSIVFFFMFEIPFSDRWGLFSWILIPILISPIFTVTFKYKFTIITTFFLIIVFVTFEYLMWN